jgi:hypothetical protein
MVTFAAYWGERTAVQPMLADPDATAKMSTDALRRALLHAFNAGYDHHCDCMRAADAFGKHGNRHHGGPSPDPLGFLDSIIRP